MESTLSGDIDLAGLFSRDLFNESSDPRIGSGRDNASTGTLSHVTTSGTNSSSASSLGSTFIPVLVFSAVCLLIFVFFRPKLDRVYAPRSIRGIRNDEELTPALPKGYINWVIPFVKIDDAFILNNCSLDGFFFLRYIRVLATIAFTGCIIAWPVLLVVNGTGGNGEVQLDLLTIGNVAFPIRFYAHAAISYVFFGFILFMICRECIYYINMRQAYLLAPQHAHRLSARTVLITCVPKRFLDEHRIRKLYGDSVKNVWIPKNTRSLERLVKEREETAERLEKAEIDLIKKANLYRNKALAAQGQALPTSAYGPLSWPLKRLRKSPTATPSTAPVTAASVGESSAPPSARTSSSMATPRRSSVAPAPTLANEATEDTAKTVAGDEIISIDRHPSVSEAASSPSARSAATTIVVTSLSDLADKLHVSEEKTGLDATVQEAAVHANENDENGQRGKEADTEDEEDDEENDLNYVHPYGFAPNLPDLRGSVAAQWLPAKERPTHRPIANFGRKVDTIRWTRMRIKALNQQIAKSRRRFRNGDGDAMSAVFIEFDTQAAAQVAYQVLTHHQPLHMSPRFIGIRPADIIWSSLRMKWWERIIRRFAINGAVAAGIVFWSIPSAMIGVVSNISFLSKKVFFLHWIADLPSSITGVIEGLLPALALSLLMSLVPSMLRGAARSAGVTSAPMVELFVQSSYFIFQVVQVFLVTTITSAASAAITSIIEDPLSIKDVLSTNLPKASNFYLSYITVQCLAGGASSVVHLIDLIRHGVLNKAVENPRRAFRNFHRLKRPHWGAVFPVYTNMGVIAISYACIAPLILAFAGVGMVVTYWTYRYNLIYYFDVDLDSHGLHYPRALMHLLVGLYMAEICLIGLFSLQSAVGPVVLMVMFLVFTILIHLSLSDAVDPMLSSLPRTLALDDEDLAASGDKEETDDEPRPENAGGLAADYYDMEEGFGAEDDEAEEQLHEGPVTTRGIDGASGLMGMFQDWGREKLKEKFRSEAKAIKKDAQTSSFGKYVPWFGKPAAAGTRALDGGAGASAGAGDGAGTDMTGNGGAAAQARPNFIIRWLHPEIYEDYSFLRTMLPVDPAMPELPEDYTKRGYWPPEMWKPIPQVWIPRDEAHVSRQEVAHSRLVVPASDRGLWLNSKGRMVADLSKAPFREPRFMY